MGFKIFFFEKNKKYKIKQNCYQNDDKFYFTLFSIVKEIEFCTLNFIQNGERNYRYYLLNLNNFEDYKEFYIFSSKEYFGVFIDEDDKEELPGYIDEIRFKSYSKGFSPIKKTYYNYFIIKIKDNYENITMYLFNDIYEIKLDITFIVGKGKNSLIKIKGDNYSRKKSYIVSSNENMVIIDSNFDPNNNLEKILFFGYISKDIYIYI